MQGGSFIQGAAGGLIGKYVGGQAYENNTGDWRVLQNTMIVAGSAYLSAKVTGGKPGTAITSAVMVYLFNEEGGKIRRYSPAEVIGVIKKEFPNWFSEEVSTPVNRFLNDFSDSAKDNITVKAGIEYAYGAGATLQQTSSLGFFVDGDNFNDVNYEITYNRGVFLNPVGNIGGDIYSTGKINGYFQSVEFCAIGCVSFETNYRDWAVGTSIGTAAGFNFQTGYRSGN